MLPYLHRMEGRVLLFGATGYTGRLTAAALGRLGVPVVLVSRSADRVRALAAAIASQSPDGIEPEVATADAAEPASVRALLQSRDDVLLSTVGPFMRHGATAVEAAIDAGACYVDSTGESPFIRWVFQDAGPRAERTGARLLPALAYDYVPGNLAGALAIRRSQQDGTEPARIEIGYFVTGGMGMSSGTRASMAGVLVEPTYAFRDGRLVTERAGARTVQFPLDRIPGDQFALVGPSTLAGLTIGATEQFTLPRLAPSLRAVDVALGWAGRWTRLASVAGGVTEGALRLPGLRPAARRLLQAVAGDVTGRGPDEQQRAGSRTLVLARAYDTAGACMAHVRLNGPTPYELTADLLAWGALMCWEGRAQGTGALGPVDAFGLDALVAGCADAGLVAEVSP